MTYFHECRTFYTDPYPSATPAMSLEMQQQDHEIAAWRSAHPGATELDYWRTMEPGDPDDTPDPCPECGGRGWVWVEEDWEQPCTDCDVYRDDALDAIMDAALDERFTLPAWEDARDRDREARPVPAGLDGLPF